jgi:heme exporter protein A
MTDRAVDLRGISAGYGIGARRRPVLEGIDIAVGRGEMVGLLGANGSGKTTLLRAICGLALPDAGAILWKGRPVHTLRESGDDRLVYLGHAPALKSDLSALENLQAATGVAGTPCSPHEAGLALAQAGLRGRGHLPVRALSQGQRKRAALARLVLSHDALLWVLDEPFDALDDAACAWLLRLVGAQLARGGVVVLTSHQQIPWQHGADGPAACIDLTAARRLEQVVPA